MNTAKRVAKNTGFLYIRMAVNIVAALYSTRLILEALGVEDFGIYNLVAGVIAMLTFLNSAMTESSQRFMSYAHGEGDNEKQKHIFNVSIVLHILISILIIVILEIAGFFLFRGILEIPNERIKVAKIVYQFMIVSTVFTIVKVPYDAVLNAHENMFVVAVLGSLFSLMKLGIAVYITYTGFDQLVAFGFLMALLSFLIFLFTQFYCHSKYIEVKLKPVGYFDRNIFNQMLSFASWRTLTTSVFIFTMQGTSILLNSFFGVVVNAAQGIANQVTGQLATFSNVMLKALNPVIVKSEGEKNRKQMLRTAMFGSKISFFLLTLLAVPVLIEMPYILGIWLKDVPEFAVIFCRLNLLRIPFSLLTVTFPVAIGAIGRIKEVSLWESLFYIGVLPVTFLLYKLGAEPETIYKSLIFMVIGISVVRVYFLKKIGGLSIKYFVLDVAGRCLAVFAIIMSFASIPLFFQEEGIIRLASVIVISSISFFVFVYLIGINKNEKKQVIALWKNLLEKKKKSN